MPQCPPFLQFSALHFQRHRWFCSHSAWKVEQFNYYAKAILMCSFPLHNLLPCFSVTIQHQCAVCGPKIAVLNFQRNVWVEFRMLKYMIWKFLNINEHISISGRWRYHFPVNIGLFWFNIFLMRCVLVFQIPLNESCFHSSVSLTECSSPCSCQWRASITGARSALRNCVGGVSVGSGGHSPGLSNEGNTSLLHAHQ